MNLKDISTIDLCKEMSSRFEASLFLGKFFMNAEGKEPVQVFANGKGETILSLITTFVQESLMKAGPEENAIQQCGRKIPPVRRGPDWVEEELKT